MYLEGGIEDDIEYQQRYLGLVKYANNHRSYCNNSLLLNYSRQNFLYNYIRYEDTLSVS